MTRQLFACIVAAGAAAGAAAGCDTPATDTRTEAVAHAGPEFLCDPTTVTTETVLGEIEGGGALVLRPTGDPCRYHLLHRDDDGRTHMLSRTAGMYFVAAAVATSGPAGSTTVVCATDLQHRTQPPSTPGPHGRLRRAILGVSLECASAANGQWSPTRTLVDGGTDFAPWVYDVEAAPGGGYLVRWGHDSTFNYLNLNDAGRPPDDGVYETTFALRGAGPDEIATVQTSGSTIEVEFSAE